MPKQDCSPAPGGQQKSRPVLTKQWGHQKQSDKTSSNPLYKHLMLWASLSAGLSWSSNQSETKTSCEIRIFERFCHAMSFLHLLIPQEWWHCAGWLKSNVAVDISLPSCHCTTVYNYSCRRRGWVGGPDTLPPPLNRAQQTALMCSDTIAQIPLLLLLLPLLLN